MKSFHSGSTLSSPGGTALGRATGGQTKQIWPARSPTSAVTPRSVRVRRSKDFDIVVAAIYESRRAVPYSPCNTNRPIGEIIQPHAQAARCVRVALTHTQQGIDVPCDLSQRLPSSSRLIAPTGRAATPLRIRTCRRSRTLGLDRMCRQDIPAQAFERLADEGLRFSPSATVQFDVRANA